MKYWLLAALLANLILLLVEFHYGLFEPAASTKDIENKSPAKEMPYSSKDNNASGQTRMSNPSDFFNGSDNSKPQKNAASPRDEQPVLRNNPSVPDAAGTSLSLGLIQVPPQTRVPADISMTNNVDTVQNEPLSPASLSISAKPALAEMPGLSKDAIDKQPEQVEPTPPVTEAPEKNESAKKILETSTGLQSLQKNGLPANTQPAHAAESNKAESIPPHLPATETQSIKNKVAKTTSSIKEPPQSQQISPKQDKVLTACYTAGPVKNVELLNTLLRQFRPQLTELVMSPKPAWKTQNHNSYVVYYPAPPSMSESFSTATLLKTRYGIKDLQVVREGEMKGSISLGVFNNERNAESAKSKFEQKGLQVQIKPRLPTGSAYKVRMRWTEQQEDTAERLMDALSVSYPDTRRIASCE
jgi:hypothetical protein